MRETKGARCAQRSNRINDQWRICFTWKHGDAHDVEIVDYHQVINMSDKRLPPIHPGKILLEEFLKPMGISQYRIAKATSVPARRINEIVHGKRSITADTALRLPRFFGKSDRFWINLQTRYDLELEKDRLGSRLDVEVELYEEAG